MAKPWLPIAVVGAIGVVVIVVFLVRSWSSSSMRNAPPKETHVAETATPVQEPPVETPKKKGPRGATNVVLPQEGDGGVNFAPQLAVIHGETAELESRNDEYVIGHWASTDDSVSWRFRLIKPHHFRAHLTYAAADDAAGGRLAIDVDGEQREVDLRASEPSGTFHTDEFFISVKRAGNHQLTLRAVKKPGAEFMTFKELRLTPFNVGREKQKEKEKE
jgi:hypothetical protein